jgi:RNA polymerase sigma factor (sigma-70 family)
MTSILAHRYTSERSFERLYRAHIEDVYRYSLMLLRNRADAEDVAQTTFMKAYRAIQRGDRPRHPRKWLITIAHNTCRTRARDDSRRPQEVSFDEELTEAASASEPDVDVGELVRALGALSFNQRAALVMRELEGRSYAEIAETLEVSGSAVETLLFRARRALREQLEGALTCGDAEHSLSLQLDGRLGAEGRTLLRAHLRECGECASLARRLRARRGALRSLGPLPLPASIASWGGAATGSGVGIKVAAILAAGAAAVGGSQERAHADAVVPAPVAATRTVERPAASPVAVTATRAGRSAAARSALRSRSTVLHEAAPARPSVDPQAAAPAGTSQAVTATAGTAPQRQRSEPVVVATPEVDVAVEVVDVEVAVTVPSVTVEVPVPPLPVDVPDLP